MSRSCMGGGGITLLILSLGTVWMCEVFRRDYFTPGEIAAVICYVGGWMGIQSRSGRFGENLFLYTGNRTTVLRLFSS